MRPRRVLGQLRRYRQLVDVLIKHQLGQLIDTLGLTRFRPRRLRREETVAAKRSRPERVRAVLESLGATFVKLGQVLSTRADLLPANYLAELARLQDQVAPCSFDQVRVVLETELGGELAQYFASFEERPLASASIGQVHAARLLDGRAVAVKVQRPDIEQVIETDLAILESMARFVDRHARLPGIRSFEDLLAEFADTIRDELDYSLEGRSAERFTELTVHNDAVVAPAVIWDLTTTRVLTMERLSGVKISELAAHPELPVTGRELMQTLTEVYLRGILLDGFFHADPHPGNLVVLADGRLAFVDFGQTGRLPARVREQLGDLFVAILRRDSEAITSDLLTVGVAPADLDRPALHREVERMLSRYYGMPLKHLPADRILEQSLQLAFRYRLALPPDLALAVKTVSTLDGLARQLDPDFTLSEAAQPLAAEIVAERVAPGKIARDLLHGLREFNRLLKALPEQVSTALARLNAGSVQVTVQHEQLQQPLHQLHHMMNRLSFSIIVGSIILGSSLVLSSKVGPFIYKDYSLLGVVGFGAAVILGLGLLVSMYRSGRL